MVKKTSLFDKLRSRFRASAVRLDAEPEGGGRARVGGDPVRRAGGERPIGRDAPARDVVARIEAQRLSGRKLTEREEAVVAIHDGFRELAGLLRGMQVRMEGQGEQLASASSHLARLPALQESQLELMRLVAERLEQQSRHSAELASRLGDLPQLVGGVQQALDRAAATDERTTATLAEFRTNMDRIHDAMGKMVHVSEQQAVTSARVAERHTEVARAQLDAVRELAQRRAVDPGEIAQAVQQGQASHTAAVRAAVDTVARAQAEGSRGLREATQEGLRALRDAHADQATRLHKTVQDGVRVDRAVLALLALTLVALVAVAAILLAR